MTMTRVTMKTLVLLAAVAVIPLATEAQELRGEFVPSFQLGYQALDDGINYTPIGFGAEVTAYVNPTVGITAEVAYGTDEIASLVDASTFAVLGGVRARIPGDSTVVPSLKVAAGVGRSAASFLLVSESNTVFVMSFGGALDFPVAERIAIRVAPDLMTDFEELLFRFSAGVVVAF